jgi:carotenoid cleavage dioxygenase-like enzyme
MTEALPENRFLQGCFAPIDQEYTHTELKITGEVPQDLNGSFYRNGPNVKFAPRGDYHLFAGDGMTHAFHIENGKVGYRNRWIETAKYKLESELGRGVINPMNPFDCEEGYMEFVLNDKDGLANTACVWHGGKMLILEEGHGPFEVDPLTLEAKGAYDFGGKLTTAMTAHPKVDPKTGEMIFFAYMASGPFESDVAVHKVNKEGVLTESHTIPTDYPAMVHDFVVTENYIIFPIFPLTGSMDRAMAGQAPFIWEPEKGAKVGVLPRHGGTAADIRWIECDPFFVFHYMNGFDKDGVITLDGCQFEHAPLFPDASGDVMPDPEPFLSRWNIDLNDDGARVKSNQIDEAASEFPQIDPRYAMHEHTVGFYTSPEGGEGEMYNAVGRFDLTNNRGERHSFGPRETTFTSEAIFVPKNENAAEGEGYLLSVVTDLPSDTSSLAILDAENVSAGPLAMAELGHRVPLGFHGGWRPAEG